MEMNQPFTFLLVLDFEATCWKATDVDKKPPEIIEFSVVLYNVKLKKIISHFSQYVRPTEVPKLSEFCIDFTGITQQQVDNGVPIDTCLELFRQWLHAEQSTFNLYFPNDFSTCNVIFATWSDWDLKTCLPKECKRKYISIPNFFNSWIDLRSLYLEHYSRRPKGLNGALTEVGLTFQGKQHCGLDDARNTAFLAGKMISDGLLLRITKELKSKL